MIIRYVTVVARYGNGCIDLNEPECILIISSINNQLNILFSKGSE